ncbi:hypothetical protein [Camelimonas lactis]|uniref:Uncharacterized protein n=1 Tax=Camelimonas lactis TaxID=659006 RepID=A0A4R2GWK1_9HYPH|nr:hypothetical protein [Camelimonas lactis]TCO15226.1 hypothetical protein EV666_102204 [Camelimonas lactis]
MTSSDAKQEADGAPFKLDPAGVTAAMESAFRLAAPGETDESIKQLIASEPEAFLGLGTMVEAGIRAYLVATDQAVPFRGRSPETDIACALVSYAVRRDMGKKQIRKILRKLGADGYDAECAIHRSGMRKD